jgi:hypothetical protein
MVSFCDSWDLAVVDGEVRGEMAELLQYSDLPGAVHDRQFVGEAFFLSDRDYALFVLFFRLIYYLDRRFTLHLMCTTRTVDKRLLFAWAAS